MAKKDYKSYNLPAIFVVALETRRPEVLRGLKDAATEEFKKLPEGQQELALKGVFKLGADLIEENEKLREVVGRLKDSAKELQEAVGEMQEANDSMSGACTDLDGAVDDFNEATSDYE